MVLVALEQTEPKKSPGIFDDRVFKGGNSLHLVKDPMTAMWRFKMEKGLVPSRLRDKFTDKNAAVRHATQYFAAKNIRIKELI